MKTGMLSLLMYNPLSTINPNVMANMAGNSKVCKLAFTSNEKKYKIYFYNTITGYPIFEFDDATKMKAYEGNTQFNYKMLMTKDKPKEVLIEGRILPIIGENFRTILKSKLGL